jgi:hypothetical protein
MRKPLTAGQKAVLDYIRGYIAENGLAPTHREIRDHFGWKSYGTVWKHRDHLIRKGYIRHEPQQPRGLSVVDEFADNALVIGLPLVVRPGFDNRGRPVCVSGCPSYRVRYCAELEQCVALGKACMAAISAALDTVCFADPWGNLLAGQPARKMERKP